jgi:hypothetical protein
MEMAVPTARISRIGYMKNPPSEKNLTMMKKKSIRAPSLGTIPERKSSAYTCELRGRVTDFDVRAYYKRPPLRDDRFHKMRAISSALP